jgi:hypothetical protein
MQATPVRWISVRERLATLEVVSPRSDPLVGELSRALSPAGILVVFSEARVVRGMFQERIHVANRDGQAFTWDRMGEILSMVKRALYPRTPLAMADRALHPSTLVSSASATRAA